MVVFNVEVAIAVTVLFVAIVYLAVSNGLAGAAAGSAQHK